MKPRLFLRGQLGDELGSAISDRFDQLFHHLLYRDEQDRGWLFPPVLKAAFDSDTAVSPESDASTDDEAFYAEAASGAVRFGPEAELGRLTPSDAWAHPIKRAWPVNAETPPTDGADHRLHRRSAVQVRVDIDRSAPRFRWALSGAVQ